MTTFSIVGNEFPADRKTKKKKATSYKPQSQAVLIDDEDDDGNDEDDDGARIVEPGPLHKCRWRRVVLDEAHTIKVIEIIQLTAKVFYSL